MSPSCPHACSDPTHGHHGVSSRNRKIVLLAGAIRSPRLWGDHGRRLDGWGVPCGFRMGTVGWEAIRQKLLRASSRGSLTKPLPGRALPISPDRPTLTWAFLVHRGQTHPPTVTATPRPPFCPTAHAKGVGDSSLYPQAPETRFTRPQCLFSRYGAARTPK